TARDRVQGIGGEHGPGWRNDMMRGRTSSSRGGAVAATQVRERWRMGTEARGLVLTSAVLTAFGLAVLYSASALAALHERGSSTYFLSRQLAGVVAGTIVFAVAAKFDAETLRDWAWPIMWATIVMMTAVLVLP